MGNAQVGLPLCEVCEKYKAVQREWTTTTVLVTFRALSTGDHEFVLVPDRGDKPYTNPFRDIKANLNVEGGEALYIDQISVLHVRNDLNGPVKVTLSKLFGPDDEHVYNILCPPNRNHAISKAKQPLYPPKGSDTLQKSVAQTWAGMEEYCIENGDSEVPIQSPFLQFAMRPEQHAQDTPVVVSEDQCRVKLPAPLYERCQQHYTQWIKPNLVYTDVQHVQLVPTIKKEFYDNVVDSWSQRCIPAQKWTPYVSILIQMTYLSIIRSK